MTKTYQLLGPDGRAYESPTKGLFGGNKRGRIYGRLDCPSALRAIKRGRTYQQHRVFFADEASAIAAGFRPCGTCMRDAYKKWREASSKGGLAHRAALCAAR
jgi:methylphosphotriester-DNA--protein-cysteine methyltransferase